MGSRSRGKLLTTIPSPFSVFVADDHPLYREGVVDAIKGRPGLELVGESGDGAGALNEIRRLSPDVALLDVKMPGLDGLEVLHAVTDVGLATRIVFLSAYLDSAVVFRAVGAGAAGFLSKAEGRATICEAVVAVTRGETVLSPELHAGIAEEIRRRMADERSPLSTREHEVLTLTAAGLSAPDIAARLHLSVATVKTHLSHVYQKLGVSDRAAAVAEAMRRKLLR